MTSLVVGWTVRSVAAVVALATLLPLIRRDAWWIRVCEFPRVQILSAALVVLFALPWAESSASGRVVLATVVGAAALLQVARILPFTRLWRGGGSSKVAAGTGETLEILIANVLMTNREAESFLTLVRDVEPDLVLVIEADSWWQRALEPLRATHPHAIEHPQDNTYGMLLYSRLRLEDAEIRYLVDDEVPSIRCSVVLPSRRRVEFFGLHPKPPAPQEATETTERDAELLLVAKEVRSSPGPVVVAGDLNDVAWSYTTRLFRRISGLLDPRIGHALLSTFPAARPLLRVPLDHLFHSADLGVVDFRRVRVGGSDHLGIHGRLRYDGGVEASPEAPTPDPGDFDLAQQKIEDGLRAGE